MALFLPRQPRERACLHADTALAVGISRTLTAQKGLDVGRRCAGGGCLLTLVSLARVLRRQDSNLNYLNQNQRCCRLHHDGLINPRL